MKNDYYVFNIVGYEITENELYESREEISISYFLKNNQVNLPFSMSGCDGNIVYRIPVEKNT